MLKALELYGFKSFADRTRFEFPAGITVVVGPNGSGKSNIVDAIKWVLGEQSAKSLRGREMADVIFKGSGTGRRKPANAAEATLYFDNSERRLMIEASEVQVTRRVYRSGEGEYLINGQSCRLRDVRDLFRGTGLGTDAYSLIEQGKVDTLLQASPRDRRAIFEEAAGISRFKAKKVETQRRLLRVDQNLLRLADIVEEVETRLKNVRAQASKARRYQEYTQRLKELRTETGRADWRRLTQQLQEHRDTLAQLEAQQQSERQQLLAAERQLAALDEELGKLSERLRHDESDWVQAHARVEAAKQRREREVQRMDELQSERLGLARRLREARRRVRELGGRMGECETAVSEAERTYQAIAAGLAQQQRELEGLTAEQDSTRGQLELDRQQQAVQMRQLAAAASRLGALEAEHEGLERRLETLTQRDVQLGVQLDQLTAERDTLEAEQKRLAETAAEASEAAAQARQALVDQQATLEGLAERQAEAKSQRMAAAERAKILTELEQKQEGVGLGARDVLQRARRERMGPFREVVGMVADLVQVRVDMAPMIDVALGNLAQFIVVHGSQVIQQVVQQQYLPPGRVGLLSLEQVTRRAALVPDGLAGQPGVMGPAERFVTAEDRYLPLVRGLLFNCWFVESLGDAIRLRQLGFRTVRFVTRAGELVEVDGSLVAGPRQAISGLVSRRSELAEMKRRIERLDQQLVEASQLLTAARTQLTQCQEALSAVADQQDAAAAEYSRHTVQLLGTRQRVHDLQRAREELTEQRDAEQARRETLAALRAGTHQETRQLESEVGRLEQSVSRLQQQLDLAEQRRQTYLQQTTRTQVELAKSEQLLETLTGQLAACRTEQAERRLGEQEDAEQLRHAAQRETETQRLVLEATSEIAEQAWLWEQLGNAAERTRARHRQLLQQRTHMVTQLEGLRQSTGRRSAECHRVELTVSQLDAQRTNLVQRVLDDYGLDLAELAEQSTDLARRGDQDVDAEIDDLRRKISNIGAVNMEALDELNDLEQRYGGLAAQYQDMVDTKQALEKIIERINKDSRRLFQDTLESIRTNFQQLFRRVFGGGTADIVLEDDADILEAGVDIVATPPGKHSLNISLLSGGERALTAVTLLLAIFQYRPSPFCVLDEVDGPLDEANIGRFVDVLRDFLQWTRFVVVTHSKKTMTAATTLYGVTMQESGVSKRVSVQFDDVSDDGQIRQEVLSPRDRDQQAG